MGCGRRYDFGKVVFAVWQSAHKGHYRGGIDGDQPSFYLLAVWLFIRIVIGNGIAHQ